MNVSKLNPIGYKAQTENGNSYNKSNLGKTGGTILMATASIMLSKSNNQALKAFTSAALIESIENLAKVKLPAKIKPFVIAASIALDALGGLWIGHEIDKYVNKKRVQKADALKLDN
ncbi:hypothetical protein HDR58_10960 [bacterium]|nr:hypothetical protein [bacterium]